MGQAMVVTTRPPLLCVALLYATRFDADPFEDLFHQAPAGESGLEQIGAYEGGEP